MINNPVVSFSAIGTILLVFAVHVRSQCIPYEHDPEIFYYVSSVAFYPDVGELSSMYSVNSLDLPFGSREGDVVRHICMQQQMFESDPTDRSPIFYGGQIGLFGSVEGAFEVDGTLQYFAASAHGTLIPGPNHFYVTAEVGDPYFCPGGICKAVQSSLYIVNSQCYDLEFEGEWFRANPAQVCFAVKFDSIYDVPGYAITVRLQDMGFSNTLGGLGSSVYLGYTNNSYFSSNNFSDPLKHGEKKLKLN